MVFNPDIGGLGQMPDYTGASRGTGTNKTFESLFGGLAETAQNAVVMRDQATQLEIEEQATEMFDTVNQEFGMTPETAPPGMQSELDRVSTLQAALEQGKISETNYYGRLATLSKQLRSQYPGYERIVDATIQSVTGTRPANAFRDAIFGEMNRLRQEESEEENYRRRYLDSNAGEIAALGLSREEAMANFDMTQERVARYKGELETFDYELKSLQREAKMGELNDRKAARVAGGYLSFLANAELEKAIGANGQNFNDMMTTFMEGGAQNIDEFTVQVGEVETRLRQALLTEGQKQFIATGMMSQDDLNKMIDAAMYPVTKAKEAVLGGNFNYAGRFATINKQITDRSLNAIFKSSPEAVVGAGLNELSQQFGQEWLSENMASGKFDVNNIAKEALGRTMMGEANILKNVIESGDQEVARQTVDDVVGSILNENLTQDGMSNVVEQLFGPSAIDFMSPDVVAAEDLESVYMKFLDPSITEAIQQRGTPEDLQKYTDWAVEKVRAIPAFRGLSADLNTIAEWNQSDVVYDPESNRISIEVDVAEGTPMDILQSRGFKPFRRATNAVNKVLQVLDPIAKANGGTGPELMKEVLQDMGVEIAAGRQDNFFSRIEQAIDRAALEEGSAGGGAGGGGGGGLTAPEDSNPQVLEEIEYEDTELDFMFSAPEIASDFGSDPVYSPKLESAASGPFTGNLNEFRNLKTPLAIAAQFDGLNETRDRTVIASFLRKAGGHDIDPSKTPWCAAFVNAVLGAAGQRGTGSLAARSFLNYGTPVKEASQGDIAVFSRGKGKGHVGFYVREDENYVYVLGGNQNTSQAHRGQVSVTKMSKNRLLGYRRVSGIQ